jgi:hypothetical protein
LYDALVHGKNPRGQIKLHLTGTEMDCLFRALPLVLPGLLPTPCPVAGLADPTPDIVKAIIRTVQWYDRAMAPYILEGDLPQLHLDAQSLMKTVQDTFQSVKNLSVPKMHSFLHIVGSVLAVHGSWDNTSAEWVELLHKLVKNAALRTNRNIGWQARTIVNMARESRHEIAAAELADLSETGWDGSARYRNSADVESESGSSGSEQDEAGPWQGYGAGRSGVHGHGYEQASLHNWGRKIRHKRGFPAWEAALDHANTTKQVQCVATKALLSSCR